MAQNAGARHFVLVHGACHGAWCWYKLVRLLEDAGHKVTALDLAASGRNQQPLNELHTFDDYHQPLYSFMEALSSEERVILVGHSMGGYAVSSAMERFPTKIALAVFASAYMVGPELSSDQIAQRFNPGPDFYGDSIYKTDASDSNIITSILFGPKFMSSNLYQQSPPQDVTLATLSARVARFFNDDKSRNQLLVTKEKYGLVHRGYVISGQDRGLVTDTQRWMVENNQPDEVRVIADADHMVMISRPKELCSIVLEMATKYY